MTFNFSVWQLPTGNSADPTLSFDERCEHYRSLDHRLTDGTRIIPTAPAMQHIFEAYDKHLGDVGQVVIDHTSFSLYRD